MSTPTVPPAHWYWKLPLLLPALAYAVVLGWSVLPTGSVTAEFSWLDVLLVLVVLAHLAAVLVLAGSRRRTFWLLVGTGLALVLLVVGELIADRAVPPSPAVVPRLPMRQRATVAEGFGELSGQKYDFSVNSLGLRGPEVDFAAADVRILCVGGSTTECLYVPDQKSWPWALQDKLAERLGKSVFVGNAGAWGHGTLNVHHLLGAYKGEGIPAFDWVVVLCGFDDWGNDVTWDETLKVETTRDVPVSLSVQYVTASPLLYRQTGLARLWDRHAHRLQDPTGAWLANERKIRADLIAARQVVQKVPEAKLTEWLKVYQTNLRAIQDACRTRGANLLLLTQPTLYRRGLPDALQESLWRHDKRQEVAPTIRYLEQVSAAYNKALLDFGRERRIECLDLAAKLPRDGATFYDDCHLTVTGCDKAADVLAEFFAQKLKGR